MWDAIDIAGSGASVDQTWIDTIGGNVANMNDGVTPGQPVYQAQYVDAAAQAEPGDPQSTGDGYGVRVQSDRRGSCAGPARVRPHRPSGERPGKRGVPGGRPRHRNDGPRPVADVVPANSAVMSHATSAYQSILSIKA